MDRLTISSVRLRYEDIYVPLGCKTPIGKPGWGSMLSVVDGGLTSIPWEDLDSTLVQAIQRESNGLTLGDQKDRLRPQDAIETIPGGDEYVVTNTNAPNSPCQVPVPVGVSECGLSELPSSIHSDDETEHDAFFMQTCVEEVENAEYVAKQPTATKPRANTTRGGQTPHPEGTKDRTSKEAQGDHPAKTGNTEPGTAAHREKGHRNMQTHTTRKKKKKEPAAQPERTGMGGQGPQGPGHGQPATDTTKAKKKKKRKKHTPTTQPRRAGHSRDPGPARTPAPHTGTGNDGRQAEHARNHTRPISRPKPKPNHEHHKEPAQEGQHHKPCPNTPTQDPSQDWRG